MNDQVCTKDPIPNQTAACQLIIIDAALDALWKQARIICDDALARGFVFVAILHGAEAFADDNLLTDTDRNRAARFLQAGDRYNFVLGRTMVHHLVRPMGASAPCVFSHGPHGKPFLTDSPAYNLSHSGRWIICAVSQCVSGNSPAFFSPRFPVENVSPVDGTGEEDG